MTLYRAAEALRSACRAAVIGHVRPDADAIGSVTACVQALSYLGISATGFVGQTDEIADNLLSIPGARDIKLGEPLGEVDVVVVVDCGSLERTGVYEHQLQAHETVIVIDHHASNPAFGTINLIAPQADSTTVILRHLFRELDVPLNHDLAYSLYAGLVTDTGSFKWGHSEMHSLAEELVSYGLDTKTMALDLMDAMPLEDLQIIGDVISQADMYHVGDLSIPVVFAGYSHTQKMSKSGIERVIDLIRSVTGGDIAVAFKELKPGYWTVSLRSVKTGAFNVARVAGALGGGGHDEAAGYSVHGTQEEILPPLLAEIQKLCS